jgi:hypothetical protein
MRVFDCLHGWVALPEDLKSLIDTKPLQRLREVSQAGAPALVRPRRRGTRLEHSIGAAVLVGKVGGGTAEQLVALLHDVGHLPFSHTADYLYQNLDEDLHEGTTTRAALESGEVAPTITKLGLSPVALHAAIADKPSWLDMIDSIDYTLRDLFRAGLVGEEVVRRLVSSLEYDGRVIVFRDVGAARMYCRLAVVAGRTLYSHPPDLYLHSRLAELLGAALECGVLDEYEFPRMTDREVLARISNDGALAPRLDDMRLMRDSNLRERRDGATMFSKSRLKMPLVRVSAAEVVPYSELSRDWAALESLASAASNSGVRLLK